MKRPEELLEILKDPTTKIVMNDIAKKAAQEERERNEKISALTSNTEYINWLIQFSKEEGGFSDSDWDYAKEKLDPATQEKVDNLQLLFEGISRYARKNYIYSSPNALGEYYRIKLNGVGLEISYKTGQGTTFYCRMVPLENESEFIDFMDIVENKKRPEVDRIESGLKVLSNTIMLLQANGIPLEAISETIDRTIKKIVKPEDESQQGRSGFAVRVRTRQEENNH